jgi:hypothetical protein
MTAASMFLLFVSQREKREKNDNEVQTKVRRQETQGDERAETQ